MGKIYVVSKMLYDYELGENVYKNAIRAFDNLDDAKNYVRGFNVGSYSNITYYIETVPFESRTIKAIDNILNKM